MVLSVPPPRETLARCQHEAPGAVFAEFGHPVFHGFGRDLPRLSGGAYFQGLRHKILAANSANSERSPFCSSMWADTGSVRKRLTT